MADPWKDAIPKAYQPGLVILGKVTAVRDTEVLVETEPGLEGIVQSTDAQRLLSVGERVEVRVLQVDIEAKRILLALCQDPILVPTRTYSFAAQSHRI